MLRALAEIDYSKDQIQPARFAKVAQSTIPQHLKRDIAATGYVLPEYDNTTIGKGTMAPNLFCELLKEITNSKL